jgi:hypothetical protein
VPRPRGVNVGRPHPLHQKIAVEVAHVLLELPSAGPLQEPRRKRLVHTLPSCDRGFIVQRLVLVHRRGDDDAVAGLAG